MVHTFCPLGRNRRGKPTTEFYIDGKPQIYCYGWMDMMTERPIEACANCKDYVDMAQIDLDKYLKEQNWKKNDTG